jgi:hypothetical protein
MRLTPTQKLAGHLLGEPVHDWITEQRERGRTWAAITARLHEQTGIAVSDESLRKWASVDQHERAAS